MKFAHMADCHVGAWRDDKLRLMSIEAFIRAVDRCIEEKVSFVLISGDLFNAAMPSIDSLKEAVKKLSDLKKAGIPVYLIAGSHDYSQSGKTMLDVIEHAGLCINVARQDESDDGKLRLKFTKDMATGAKIVGLLGRRGGLEQSYYKILDRESLEFEDGFKIFMFHSAIEEYKPEHLAQMHSMPLSMFPKGFDYYAGGHVHVVSAKEEEGYGLISYPGPLFPNDFRELEELGGGGFYIYEDGKLRYEPIRVRNVRSLKFKCDDLSPEEVKEVFTDHVKNEEFVNTIITLRFSGKMRSGVPSDIDWNSIVKSLYDKGAYFVMKSTSRLSSPEFDEIKTDVKSTATIEADVIAEHLGQVIFPDTDSKEEANLIRNLLDMLDDEKQEGERNQDYEKRISSKFTDWIS